ncbi:ACR115Wp [Eremothecium gossypii ATCC 10895]|uniref:ACR115Wp n=1 Tax=Eremothecium gossypii (strain ATCC 10895 / CBS 109.51 / FGSC 9923 / NRRL Y-1056) TaxID=284811 RepID=Q75C04_EREGS|nr:ACR115Wp [Eremothecium gossypii ATCC 10895]AAS51341.2 ACR115Wp [Eremothecium gossypii ATCC 10895]
MGFRIRDAHYHTLAANRWSIAMSLPDWCPPFQGTKQDPSTGEDVYCICKKPDGGELMVQCDGCGDWFHFTCIRIPSAYKSLVFSFYCPYCQAGITYSGTGALPRTVWKRRCRMEGCYRACARDSKYCGPEHGEAYMRALVERAGPGGQAVVQQMVRTGQFESLGTGALPLARRDVDPALYDRVVGADARLGELEAEAREVREARRPALRAQLAALSAYLAWVREVNDALFHDTEEAAPRRGKARARRKPKRALCGFRADYQAPLPAADFAASYADDAALLHGVCCRLRCPRHQDWASMRLGSVQFELEALDSAEQRLQLLISMRKEHLSLRFHELRAGAHPRVATPAT